MRWLSFVALAGFVLLAGPARAQLAPPPLTASEAGVPGLPHTIAEHVGKSVDWLQQRLDENPSLRRVSTYPDLPTAQAVTSAVIALPSNQSRLQRWLISGPAKLALHASLGRPTGIVLERGRAPFSTSAATVVVKRDAATPAGFVVLTSYPDVPRRVF